MNINKHNCEAYFLDYYEKNLSPVEVAELLFFLEENPDLKEVFENYEIIFLEQEKVKFPDKENIKKKYSAEAINEALSSEMTRANCEQYFIANAEGILSHTQKEKLHFFLLQYPELKKEAELFLKCRLQDKKTSFEGKEDLKKQLITDQNCEEFFVRAIDKDLTTSETNALNLFLEKNPKYKSEYELFAKTILPAESVVFADKASLKKEERKPVIIPLFSRQATYYAVAAAVLFLVGLFLFMGNNETDNTLTAENIKPIANSEKGIEKKEQVMSPESLVFSQQPRQMIAQPETGNQKQETKSSDEPLANREQKAVNSDKLLANTERGTKQASSQQPVASSLNSKVEKEEPKLKVEPIISEDEEEQLITQEKPEFKMQELLPVVAKVEDSKKENTLPQEQMPVVLTASANAENEYQTPGQIIRKKIKTVLGIDKSTECETADDKIQLWDLAMAAKNGIQRMVGSKEIDVSKICDGTGKKVEYVFAAGNFQISRGGEK